MLRSLFFQHVGQTSPSPMALEISHGLGNYLYDTTGKAYLDLIAGISVSNIGHSNPLVVESIKNQADRHLHTLVYGEHIQSAQVELAKAIADTLPKTMQQILFVNSGSEAIEAAMKLAKRATGRFEIISCHKAYHGSSHGALSLNGDEYYKRNFRPLLPGIRQIHYGSFSDLQSITEKTACVIIETVQGEAGIKVACAHYFQELRKRCDEVGALLILDEIQTGFGRTGTFWGFQKLNVEPDVVVMAKGMGGGMPLGAIAASQKLLFNFTENPVLGHISTFGGHPVCCAASLATLKFIQDNKLTEQVEAKELAFIKGLQDPQILEIRSSGLMIAVELGSFDKILKVIAFCLKNGLITDWFLHCNKALRIAPPLTISFDEIEFACDLIKKALKA
jgi:putrescine aminotransferase